MNKILFRILLNICKEYRWALAFFLIAGISQTFIGLYAISYFQRLIDALTQARQFADVSWTFWGYVTLTLANHILIYLGGYPSSLLNHGAYQWAKLSAMQKVARIDYLAYQNLGTGQLIQVVENGANATRSILNGFYLNLLRGILPSVIISFVFIHYYDPTLLVIILGAYALLFFASYLFDELSAPRRGPHAGQSGGFLQILDARIYGTGGFPYQWPVSERDRTDKKPL